MNKTVAAVVVTYNRKNLLTECLDALLSQTRPVNKIILIDNASTDGTMELLEERGYLGNPALDYVRLNENTGGAGGFHEGLKRAYTKGYDFAWIMDDDAIPERSCLQYLLNGYAKVKNAGFICSHVQGLNKDTMNTPELDTRKGSNGYPNWDVFLSEGLVKVRSCTFVSVLIPRNVIREVGLPHREFFIWGDDIEYTCRITNKYDGYICGFSVVTHKRNIQAPITLRRETNPKRIENLFYSYRNGLYVQKQYFSLARRTYWLFLAAQDIISGFLSGKHRLLKFYIGVKGLICGIFFRPKSGFLKL